MGQKENWNYKRPAGITFLGDLKSEKDLDSLLQTRDGETRELVELVERMIKVPESFILLNSKSTTTSSYPRSRTRLVSQKMSSSKENQRNSRNAGFRNWMPRTTK